MSGNKILVTFTEEQLSKIRGLQGILGDGDATIVRTIVIDWLMSKNLLLKDISEKPKTDDHKEIER